MGSYVNFTTTDLSSVGRAEDCSWTITGILRSLVRIRPSDLLPDHDDEELEFGMSLSDYEEDYQRYSGLALSYYNSKHGTDFKFVKWAFIHISQGGSLWVHFAFRAAPSADVECRSAAKHFCSKLYAHQSSDKCNLVVTSCCMVDGPETTDCKVCYSCSLRPPAPDVHVAEVPPLSQHSDYLADGVTTLRDKAKSRASFSIACTHILQQQAAHRL